MKKLKSELDAFITSISKEEMKHNTKLREKITLLQELMRLSSPRAIKRRRQSVLDFLNGEALLR